MKKVQIYTDGACSGNPGDGGYCAILVYGDREKVVSGAVANTTNNRMELTAAIVGLKTLKEPCEVELFSDSSYLVDAFNSGWIDGWRHNGWKTAGKKAVKNVDLWEELLSLGEYHSVKYVKVKGHSDNEYNNRCDKIAVSEYKKVSD